MQKITVNGKSYIGKLNEDDGQLILTKAMQCDSVKRPTIQEYLKRKNLGELDTEVFGGQGISYSVAEFTDEQTMPLTICKLAMKQAKRVAAKGMENDIFDGLLGKL